MEKLTILEMKTCDLLHWAVINAVVKLGKLENTWLEFPKDGKWEMKLIMNDVELPVMETFKELESQLDTMIKDKAKKIVNDKFDNLFSAVEETMEDMLDEYKNKITAELKKLD